MLGEHMEREIGEQPALLRRNAEPYLQTLRSAFANREFEAIVLVARGSSDNSALYARYLIEVNLGIPAMLAAPSVLTRYGVRVRYPRCLCVGISQSGAAPDVAEVVATARASGHATLAITNTPGSRLTEAAECALLMDVGKETSVAATKTYTATLLTLYQLAQALKIGGAASAVSLPGEDWLQTCREEAKKVAGIVATGHPVFALARGYSFSTALESALKLMECAIVPCKGFSTADFQHGPKALAGPGSVAVYYGDKPEGLEEQGCRLIGCPAAPCDEKTAPLWQALFAQCLALEAARLKGLDPDAPRHLQKITKTL